MHPPFIAPSSSGVGGPLVGSLLCIEKDVDSLLAHYRFEERFWRALKNMKSMESLAEGTLRLVVAFTALRLELDWQMHTI